MQRGSSQVSHSGRKRNQQAGDSNSKQKNLSQEDKINAAFQQSAPKTPIKIKEAKKKADDPDLPEGGGDSISGEFVGPADKPVENPAPVGRKAGRSQLNSAKKNQGSSQQSSNSQKAQKKSMSNKTEGGADSMEVPEGQRVKPPEASAGQGFDFPN